MPVAAEYEDYLTEVADRLRKAGVRVEVDTSDDRMGKKIRNAEQQKVPYILIAGGEDEAAGAVSFRYRDRTQKNGIPVDEAVAEITDAIAAPHPGLTHRPPPETTVYADKSSGEERGAVSHEVDEAASLPGTPDGFERLWTPHRMVYIQGENKPATPSAADCPFCTAPEQDDRERLIVHRGELAYAVLNLYPYSPGTS